MITLKSNKIIQSIFSPDILPITFNYRLKNRIFPQYLVRGAKNTARICDLYDRFRVIVVESKIIYEYVFN